MRLDLGCMAGVSRALAPPRARERGREGERLLPAVHGARKSFLRGCKKKPRTRKKEAGLFSLRCPPLLFVTLLLPSWSRLPAKHGAFGLPHRIIKCQSSCHTRYHCGNDKSLLEPLTGCVSGGRGEKGKEKERDRQRGTVCFLFPQRPCLNEPSVVLKLSSLSVSLSLSRYMSGFPPLVPPPLIMCQPTISLMERGTCNQAGQADLTHRESGTRQSANTQLSRPHAPKGAGDR